MRSILCLVVLFACAWAGSLRQSAGLKSRGSEKAISDQVLFYLYSPTSPDTYELITPGASINNLVATADIKIATHGYDNNASAEWMVELKDRYIQLSGSNVILLDWSALANSWDYYASADAVPAVGIYGASMVDSLVEHQGVSFSSIHAIGHSLGAHVVGYIGKNVNGGQLARITGLDPAYPGFELASSDGRLANTDAVFVDVIHSNSGDLLDGDLSFEEALGDADFYPNGGSQQPGCDRLIEADIYMSAALGLATSSCNHDRSHDLFVDSITNDSAVFASYPCDSDDDFEAGNCFSCASGCSYMGNYANSSAYGTFYLATRAESPFTGQNLRIFMKVGELSVLTYGDLELILTDENGVYDGYNYITHEYFDPEEGIDRVMGFLPSLGTPTSVNLTFSKYFPGLIDSVKFDQIKIYNTNGDTIAEYTEKFELDSHSTMTLALTQ